MVLQTQDHPNDSPKAVQVHPSRFFCHDRLSKIDVDLRDQIIDSFDRSIAIAEDLNPDLTRQIIDDRRHVESLNHELNDLIELFTDDLDELWDLHLYNHGSEDYD